MSRRTHKLPEPPASIVKGEAAATVKAALDQLMAVSNRDDFDVSTLTYMYLEDAPNKALQLAVDRLRAKGFSWDEIARATGMARASAYQRWHGK